MGRVDNPTLKAFVIFHMEFHLYIKVYQSQIIMIELFVFDLNGTFD